MKKLFLFTSLTINFLTLGQLTVDNSFTPQQLVENILAGPGVVISNVTFNGGSGNIISTQCGSFNGQNANVGINSGLILATGNIQVAVGPNNNPGAGELLFTAGDDIDLNDISTQVLNDQAILEFDFVPVGDSISFKYVFSSEEYNEYVCSNFNDVFGFFISGPGINGPFSNNGENIALIPGTTTPVSINTVNIGLAGDGQDPVNCENIDPNWESYSVFFNDNTQQSVQFDGMTVVLTAISPVQCGQTYHIKMAIADAFDSGYDSGVFLQAGSLSSSGLNISLETVTGDTIIYEDCNESAQFIFSRPQSLINDTSVVQFVISGTAIQSDYVTNLPDSIIFLPGVDSLFYNINALQDGIFDDNETFIVTATFTSDCGILTVVTSSISFKEKPPLTIVANDVTVICPDSTVTLSAIASNGFAPYTYLWSNSDVNASIVVPSPLVNGSQDYTITATDICGFTATETVTLTLAQTLFIDNLTPISTINCAPTGSANANVIGSVGTLTFSWSGPGTNGPVIGNTLSISNLTTGNYFFTVNDQTNCLQEDSVFVDILDSVVASFNTSTLTGAIPQTVTFFNTSLNADSFDWDFGNGSVLTGVGIADQQTLYTTPDTFVVELTAYQGICEDSVILKIILVSPPTVYLPNIFTPNGDLKNEGFTLAPTNFKSFTFTILNRWGNTMFEGDNTNNFWNGLAQNNKEAEPGTYFYTYSGIGLNGEEKQGEGLFQLVR